MILTSRDILFKHIGLKGYECLNFIFQNSNLRTFQRFFKQIMPVSVWNVANKMSR